MVEEVGEAGMQYSGVYAGEVQGQAQAVVGDGVAVGGGDAVDESVVA